MKYFKSIDIGDFLGGISSSFVALPSAIAFGLIIYSPLGPELTEQGLLAGCIGAVLLGLFTSIFGGTPKLISGPAATSAAVLTVFVNDQINKGISPEEIKSYIIIVGIGAGVFQLISGFLKSGHFIKYLPYPVVTGYLGGVGITIIVGQFSKLLGIQSAKGISGFIASLPQSRWETIVIGSVTILVMIFIPRIIKIIPAPIMALLSGVLTYFLISIIEPDLRTLENNKLIVGHINLSYKDFHDEITGNFFLVKNIELSRIIELLVPILTLSTLLSVDTLKTCVLLDVLTGYRHNSNKELLSQGFGNVVTSICGGIPGGGATGFTMVNYYSGGKTQISSIISSITSLITLLFLTDILAWIPISALAGMLIVIGFRMIDLKSLKLVHHKSTRYDFFVIVSVIFSAVTLSLMAAGGIGILLAVSLFMREQVRFSVVRNLSQIGKIHSKKTRTPLEQKFLENNSSKGIVLELQGQLFFGTTDQLYKEVEKYFQTSKFFILDMRRVLSLDFTASNMLQQIRKKVNDNKGILIFSNFPQTLPPNITFLDYLKNFGFNSEGNGFMSFKDLSDAIEYVEDKIITEGLSGETIEPLDLSEFEFFEGISQRALVTIKSVVRELNLKKGDKVFRLGEKGGQVYFIRKGNIRIEIPANRGIVLHRATFATGGFFGEFSFLDNEKRSADAVVSSEVASLYILTRKDFDTVAHKFPEISTIFYEKLSYQLSHRLRSNVIELTELQD